MVLGDYIVLCIVANGMYSSLLELSMFILCSIGDGLEWWIRLCFPVYSSRYKSIVAFS